MNALTRRLIADIDHMNIEFSRLNAIITEPDGFRWIDETKVPAALAARYRRAVSTAYALGVVR